MQTWPIDRVRPYERNPRLIGPEAVAAVAGSIRSFGFRQPILVDEAGVIIAGHTRLQAAQHLGLAEVPVIVCADLTPTQVRAYRLADNRVAEFSEWDLDTLQQELGDLGEIDLEFADFADLLAASDKDHLPNGDADDAPPIERGPADSTVGKVYDLGPHRLVVGDACDPAIVGLALGGRPADMVWTDPPYGVDYKGKTKRKLQIDNDHTAGLDGLLRAAFTTALAACRPGAAWYVASPGGPNFLIFAQALYDLGIWRETLNWIKDAFALAYMDYHYRHEQILVGAAPQPGQAELSTSEPIAYGWKPGRQRQWSSGRAEDTCIEVPRPRRSADHPTMKPVDLVETCIRNSSRLDDLVLDPFAGSGTTLIAAARSGRVCAAVEIDPHYADVIRRRWTSIASENGIDPGPGALA